MSSIEDRLRRMEDIHEIGELKARYCEACDHGHDPEGILSLFVEDGIWEGKSGAFEGHDAIRLAFERFGEEIYGFTQHNVTNLRIRIDGDEATGLWHFIGVHERRDSPEVGFTLARYEDDFVRVGGEWRFKHLRATLLGRIPTMPVAK